MFKKGKKLSEKWRKNISEAKKGEKNPAKRIEVREKISNTLKRKGIKPKTSEEIRRKISEALKGKKKSEEHKKKIVETRKRNGSYKHTEETKRKLSEINKGERNPSWKGGISFEPYTTDWTETLKRAIRERDHYICQICGKEPAVDTHHIDYDKKNCNPNNLITLCRKCHAKTNYKRNYWISYFNNFLVK